MKGVTQFKLREIRASHIDVDKDSSVLGCCAVLGKLLPTLRRNVMPSLGSSGPSLDVRKVGNYWKLCTAWHGGRLKTKSEFV